jgi:hypothetical protein
MIHHLERCKRTEEILREQGTLIVKRNLMTLEDARNFVRDHKAHGEYVAIHACEQILMAGSFDERWIADPQAQRWMKRWHPRCNNCGKCGVA